MGGRVLFWVGSFLITTHLAFGARMGGDGAEGAVVPQGTEADATADGQVDDTFSGFPVSRIREIKNVSTEALKTLDKGRKAAEKKLKDEDSVEAFRKQHTKKHLAAGLCDRKSWKILVPRDKWGREDPRGFVGEMSRGFQSASQKEGGSSPVLQKLGYCKVLADKGLLPDELVPKVQEDHDLVHSALTETEKAARQGMDQKQEHAATTISSKFRAHREKGTLARKRAEDAQGRAAAAALADSGSDDDED